MNILNCGIQTIILKNGRINILKFRIYLNACGPGGKVLNDLPHLIYPRSFGP